MLNFKYFIIIFVFAGSLYANPQGDYRIVKGITFKGLKKVSKYTIIRESGIKTYKNNFVYRPEFLKKVLAGNKLIKNFKIIEKNNYLTIIVSEKKDVLLIAVVDNRLTRFCEVDSNFNVLSIDKIHNRNYPLILIGKKDVTGNSISARIKKVFMMYQSVSKELAVGNEVELIDMREYFNIKVTLKNRKTVFSLLPEKGSFLRLNALVGYLDRINYYPEYIYLKNSYAVLH